MNSTPGTAPARWILAFVVAMSAAKLLACLITGFGDDEAYTLVIARQLSLSYFDHPPLHQWLLHGFVSLIGESHAARLPFWAIHVATNLPLYGLTKRLFGRDAALWALFAFNASAYFITLPDGYIMPDPPLLFALLFAVWLIAEIMFAPGISERRKTWLWLAVGASFGLAGLSKYSAALAPLGLFGFFALSPVHRRWFADFRPYAAAALALVIFSPVLIWNARHGWVSLLFQSDRAAGVLRLDSRAAVGILEGVGGQLALLSPWIAIPMIVGLYRALGSRNRDDGERLLLWLALPPLLLFALLPLVGQRAIPHWFNSGWLFAYPLAGAWLASLSSAAQVRWARVCSALSAITLLLYVPLVIFGTGRFFPGLLPRDPTMASYDWPSPAATQSWNRGGEPPAFVLVESWRVGGRVGVALGPDTPICGFGSGPRGLAFTCDKATLTGRDAIIVAANDAAAQTFSEAAPLFQSIDPPEAYFVGRGGQPERRLQVARAQHLIKPISSPYGR